MPVPTSTFRNMKKLNALFAFSALALLGSTLWLVVADHEKPWRGYQREAKVWEIAMKEDAQRVANNAQMQTQYEALQARVRDLTARIESDTEIAELRARLARLEDEQKKLSLPLNIAKGEITPAEQHLEYLIAAKSDQVDKARKKLNEKRAEYNELNGQMAEIVKGINDTTEAIELAERRLTELRSELARQEMAMTAVGDELKTLKPSLIGAVRDKPLLNWMNPWEKPRQVVATGVHTDLHFMQVETVDRCMTCHVNIDKPAYEEHTLVRFVERQIATMDGQDVANLEVDPVVMLDFWVSTAQNLGLGEQVAAIEATTLQAINAGRARGGVTATIAANDLYTELRNIARTAEHAVPQPKGSELPPITLDEYHQPRTDMLAALTSLVESHLGAEEYRKLRDVYRQTVIAKLNEYRAKDGLKALSDSRVLLGHPKMDLYVGADSPHPMDTPGNVVRTLGCTVCHEGAGQETEFVYTAHTPRDVWVDAKTGTLVPPSLIAAADRAIEKQKNKSQGAQMVLASTSASSDTEAGHGHDGASYVHDDLYLPDPTDTKHPFAPPHEHATEANYLHPDGEVRRAVKQDAYWTKQYGWHHVHFDHWERPMHSLDYVESSCNKCHTEIYDIKDAAPQLFEGRQLFAQVGCANCHSVADLADAGDVKKIGPSLVHVKEKLSSDMMGSWIWSPRGFRPTTRMPHYFMLENNSSPFDIRRTRTEVAAMTYYLQHAEPDKSYYEAQNEPVPTYHPQPLSESMLTTSKDSIERGKEIFNTIGCLACHSNLEDQNRPWLVADIAKRFNTDKAGAEAKLAEMTYNERHWYAQRYIPDKFTLVGPELSGVGTKLMAGWSEDRDEAFKHAKTWLHDWLRNPRHYSSYTIMPALRLSEAQASDLADYLLSLERPGAKRIDGQIVETDAEGKPLIYEPGGFGVDDVDTVMLKELVVALQAVQSTPEMVIKDMDAHPDDWTIEKQLEFLGQKMITHYGCVGCHTINGLEDVASACAELNDWGRKDPHKLDFGYFGHAHDRDRELPFPGHKIPHEGLSADAPHLTSDAAHEVQTIWEHMHELERRPWLYNKLHNPRVYDRGKVMLDGKLSEDKVTKQERIEVGRPYDKLKMPKFFLSDDQARALTTYVTSLTKPGVVPEFQAAATNEQQMRIAHGRQVATLYNCYGCHNIEGNDVAIQQFYGIYDAEGRLAEHLINWAPPRLVGQGAKTQPNWLHHFLQNVNGQPNLAGPGDPPREGEDKIRPWLKVRMPSFAITPDQATTLVDYFAAHSLRLSGDLAQAHQTIIDYVNEFDVQIAALEKEIADLESQIEQYKAKGVDESDHRIAQLRAMQNDRRLKIDDPARKEGDLAAKAQERHAFWFDKPSASVRAAMDEVLAFAEANDMLINSGANMMMLEPDSPKIDVRRQAWATLLWQVSMYSQSWQTSYPYVERSNPVSDERFVRGEKLFHVIGCTTGACHRVGDEAVLAANGFILLQPGDEPEDEGYGDYGAADAGDSDYGADDDYGYGGGEAENLDVVKAIAAEAIATTGAPNLSRVADRLQRNWVSFWIVHAKVMAPGTAMNKFWKSDPAEQTPLGVIPTDGSYFRFDLPYPEDDRKAFEALYGPTGDVQQELVLDFLYDVNRRAITYSPAPEGKRLTGPAVADVELKPLELPGAPDAGEDTAVAEKPAEETMPDQPEQPTPQDSPPAEEPPAVVEKSLIEDFHDEPTKATPGSTRIIGQVKFEGKIQPRAPIRNLNVDPICMAAHRGKPTPRDERVVINDDHTMRNIVVHVVKGLEGKPKPQLNDVVQIDQIGCIYVPHTVAVMTNQPVEIHSSDSTNHNVNYRSDVNPRFNESMVKGQVLKRTFANVDLGGNLSCQVHGWMKANLLVFDHPYFAVSDAEGRFEIKGLPPGTYTLETWSEHPAFKPVQFEVTVEEGASHRVDATIKPPGA